MKSAPRKILLAASAIVVGLLLFPPWKYTYYRSASNYAGRSEQPAGHAFIFAPPRSEANPHYRFAGGLPQSFGIKLDIARLMVEILSITAAGLLIAAMTGGFQPQARAEKPQGVPGASGHQP